MTPIIQARALARWPELADQTVQGSS
jgi:hypothetical protein